MLPKPRTVQKVVKILTDLDITHVSQVGHGANQVPYKFVKAEDEQATFTEEQTNITRPAPGGVGIQKIVFEKQAYSRKKVVEYLESLNFQDYDLVSEANQYVAKSKFADVLTENPNKVAAADGVSMYMATVKTDLDTEVQKNEGSNNVQKVLLIKNETTEDVVKKFDCWAASYATASNLGEALDAGMWDGIPIGATEINYAFWAVVATAAESKNYDIIKKAAAEMGDLIVQIAQIFQGVIDKSELEEIKMSALIQKGLQTVKKSEEAAAEKTAEEVTTPAEETKPAEEVKVEETKTEEAPAAEETKPAEEVKTEETKVEKSANDALLASISSMIDDKLKSFEKQLGEKIEKSDTRIAKLEGSGGQPRATNSSDEDAQTKVTKKETTDHTKIFKAENKALGSLFGI